MIDDFEKAMSEFEGEEGAEKGTFDSYVNKMACSYQLLKDRIEEKYETSGGGKEYYAAEDGSIQELTKERELEMLDKTYETHSRFMAAATQIWSELQHFKVQTVYHSGGLEKETAAVKNRSTGIKERAYRVFMAAVSEKNGKQGVSVPSYVRDTLNGIWDYYAD